MSKTNMQKTRDRLFKIYGAGIVAFIGFFGSITLLVNFLSRLDWN